MSNPMRDRYVQYRTNPDNDDKTDSYFCSSNGYALEDLKTLLRDDTVILKDILHARRNSYSGQMLKIDDAMFRAAMSGDTKAADLLYRRFDGWNPKIVEENNHFYNFTDIIKRAAKRSRPSGSVTKRAIPDGSD